ncbi:MAG: polymer-forming cytoskeletal protein [Proteobacteria bacterium]|nr:polymer-forming cytoskeletal protein [Pseudomonadota bacterium]
MKRADSISTFLGSNGSIEGVIQFKNTIRLDGNVKGKIFSNAGTVIIGEQAVINAEIYVDVAIVMGRVNGTIAARKRIELYPPGHIVGDIQAPTIIIESGVIFNGNCAMKPQPATTKNLPEAAEPVKKPPAVEDLQAKEKFSKNL